MSKGYIKWKDVLKYAGTGVVSVITVLILVLNLSGMSYTVPGDQTCGTDCYSQLKVNSTYWEVCVEHSGNQSLIYKKVDTSRRLWLNLDKMGMFIPTDPEVFVELMVATTSKYATVKNEYGYLRPVKGGDCILQRGKENKLIIHGIKGVTQTVKWGMNFESILSGDMKFDPLWIGENITYTPSSETHCNGSICETINYETNEKIMTDGVIMIKSPYEIVCRWSNPNSLWKDCEIVIEVNNSNTKSDLILKGDELLAKFLKDVQNFTVYTTYNYNLYNDTILNNTCFDSLNVTPEERESILENKSLCFYNYTRKSFYNFQPTTKLDKIYKNSVIGIKLEFQSPIVAEAGAYLKNHFNFTLLSDYNMTLDPDISTCSVLDTAGATYTLTADIIDSSATVCMNITANNVTLDCQGHTIDGTDTLSTFGIYVYRASATTTNETIKNCTLTDWGYGIRLYFSSNNTITNSTANSNSYYGIVLSSSSNNTITSSTANSNSYYGILLSFSSNNQITNSTANSNSYDGIRLYSSSNYVIVNCIVQANTNYGIYLSTAGNPANLIYNNLFNNTNNFFFGGTIYANNWNTTRQTGTRIYSNGTEIGGNYWTNSTKNGYSDTCTDADTDGFCDNSYTINATGPNIDYLPLSDEYSVGAPTYSLNSTNSTVAGTPIMHSLYWTDDAGLSGYIFSFDNCTGTLVNNSFVSFSGTTNWSNVTKMINSTIGCTIRWCVYANDTSNNWNGTSCITPFSYLTTSAGGSTCDCSSIQAGTAINCAENCDIGACNVGGIAVTFINTGTVTTSGDVTNILRTTWSSGCTLILGVGKRWG
jgi:parallel beta-helix repeat protein